MSIQKKIILLFAFGLLLPSICLYLMTRNFIQQGFRDLELKVISRRATIVLETIAKSKSLPESNDAITLFQKLENKSAQIGKVLPGAFAAMIDTNGEIVAFYPPDTSAEPDLVRNDMADFIKQNKKFAVLPIKRKGLASINNQIWQVSVTPLSEKSGRLIYFGQPLQMIISKLPCGLANNGEEHEHEPFSLESLNKRWEYLIELRSKAEKRISGKMFFHPFSTRDGRFACLSIVDNVFDQPTICFKMISAVNITAIAEKNIWLLSSWLLGINIVVLFITLLLVQRQVIKPIDRACEVAAESLKEFAAFDSDHELELDINHKRGRLNELLELTGKATELYKNSSETANTLFKNVPFGIILYDSDFNIKQINEPAQKLLGYKEEELIDHKCNEVFCPAGCVSCPVKSQGSVNSVEMVFLRNDGSPLPVLITGTTIELHGEEMILEGFVDLTEQDRSRTLMKNYKSQLEKTVTKLQEQNQQLHKEAVKREKISEELQVAKERAESDDRLKSTFLANMSHELRTPLSTIVGFANLMTGKPTDEERKRYGDAINQSSETLMELISDIIDLSKLESGKIEFSHEMVDINAELTCLEEIYQNKLKKEKQDKVKLIVRKSDSALVMKTDPVRLRQIFANLLNNAIKFTDEGSIEFGLEDIGRKMITFFVKDTGIGIDQDAITKIFERFSISENNEQQGLCGAGLGLAICMGLVNVMNGRIIADSVPGNGSVFRFELPLSDK
jgi:PAS domain S-box-containing protein